MKLPLQIFFLFCILNVPFVYAQDIPGPMSPPSLVNDFAGIFSRSERDKLEETLKNYNDTTSTQIYVVTVKDLGGYDANTFATELGEKWGVGQKGKDNGVVILIKPKVGNSRGQSYIAVGYGLEEWLTDSRVGRIQDEYMIPYFQKNDYYGGVDAAVHVIMKMLSGQFQADEESDIEVMDVLYAIIILAVLFFVIYRSAKNNNGSNSGGSSRGGGFFPPIIGGGRGSGGSFGGGFGGGGGGSFGGGGAGRSW